MAGYDEAGHAVWDTGARGQEGDAHDDFWDAQGETDDGNLEWGTSERVQTRIQCCVYKPTV